MASAVSYGATLLAKQLKELFKNPPPGFSVGLEDDANVFKWNVMIEGPQDTPYEGGFFEAVLDFPENFPNSPPVMRIKTPHFWHPNVYPDGRVCISILHEAKHDPNNPEERMDEKWRPIISVEGILISVISMLSDPNVNSPANVDASVEFKNKPESYRKKILRCVRQSQEAMMNG